ncbi:hypothetical protein [Streptomyces chartreusis]|uniref:hypothetical protein n=1 Tax=Streptomyces chartreusis TaxID=1969 RepID=UPI0037AD707E
MMASAPLSGGLIDDLERDDNERGPEPDESEGLHLRVVISQTHAARPAVIPAAPSGGGLQCDNCGQWFGVTFWTCGACLATAAWRGLPPLPHRPPPHQRDGRKESPAPARPHPQAALPDPGPRR